MSTPDPEFVDWSDNRLALAVLRAHPNSARAEQLRREVEWRVRADLDIEPEVTE